MTIQNTLNELKAIVRPFFIKDQLSVIELEPGDIAIDCGANIGLVTKRMAKKDVIVYAFEPNPYAFKRLQRRFRNNTNVNCINKGVLDRKDKLKLYLHKHAHNDQLKWSTGSSFVSDKTNVKMESFVEVDVIDLNEFIESLNNRVKVLKMDVEGVEYQILDSLIDSDIVHNIDHVLVETHENKIPTLNKIARKVKNKIKEKNLLNIDLGWT